MVFFVNYYRISFLVFHSNLGLFLFFFFWPPCKKQQDFFSMSLLTLLLLCLMLNSQATAYTKLLLTNPLSLKGGDIQCRLFIAPTNKTKHVFGAIVHFFPDRSHYCRHVHGLLNKGAFYKGLMNRMHLPQLFRSRFKHREALNYRAGFSRQDERLYVAHYPPGFLQ